MTDEIELLPDLPDVLVCMDCKHYHRAAKVPQCDAFPAPGRIPDMVWVEGDPHTGPIEGDHGIRFEPIMESETGR